LEIGFSLERCAETAQLMNITDFLSPQHAIVDLRAADKPQLLRELARRAAPALGLARRSDIGRAHVSSASPKGTGQATGKRVYFKG